jgi:hypothetical protein
MWCSVPLDSVAVRARVAGVSLWCCGLITLGAARPVSAQQAVRHARIQGEIVDSVHVRKLSGALVMAIRLSPEPAEFFSATTDDNGYFHFDTLAAGRYSVVFATAFLDSLGIVLPPRELVLAPDEEARVDMGTPSGARLRDAACPGLSLPLGQGAVVGEVSDADSDSPLAGVRVAVGWTDLAVDRTEMRVQLTPRIGAVTTDSLGQYRLCGVPTNQRLVLQVQTGKSAGAEIELFVDEQAGVARRPLSLSVGDTTMVLPDSLRPLRLTGTAQLTGTIRTLDGRPLAGAQVHVVDGLSSALTDSAGHFTVSHLPAGSQVAEVRKLGYTLGRAQVELRRGRTTELELRLTRFVSLDSVRVLARRTRYREFEAHRRNWGWGNFLDEEQVANRHVFYTSDLLRMTPGMRVFGEGPAARVVSSRGVMSLRGAPCDINIVIDGLQQQNINMVRPHDIGAMEIYPSSFGVPIQYSANSQCGAVVIWTKRLTLPRPTAP